MSHESIETQSREVTSLFHAEGLSNAKAAIAIASAA